MNSLSTARIGKLEYNKLRYILHAKFHREYSWSYVTVPEPVRISSIFFNSSDDIKNWYKHKKDNQISNNLTSAFMF